MSVQFNRNRFDTKKQVVNKTEHVINDDIRQFEVRVTTEHQEIGLESGSIYNLNKVKDVAYSNGYDVVLINTTTQPAIVRVCDYSKFLYELKKRKKDADRKQKEANKEMKEVRLSPTISEADLNTKINQISRFIKDGHKVKMNILFKNRMIIHSDMGKLVMLRIADELSEVAKADNLPELTGKNMNMILSPKKK